MAAPERLSWPNFPEPSRRYTEQEYLDFDEKSAGRWEYMGGYIYPVGRPDLVNQLDPQFRAGATPAHYIVASNLMRSLFGGLADNCRPFASDARVYTPVTKGYVYPDVVIVCGDPEYHESGAKLPSLTNPVVAIEILSESTAEYDRIGKFMRYRSIESLQHYLLVDSRKVMVELFTRNGDTWLYAQATQPEDVVELVAVECWLTVRELYDGLDLPSVAETAPPDEMN